MAVPATYSVRGMARLLNCGIVWVNYNLGAEFERDELGRYSQGCFCDLQEQRSKIMALPQLGTCVTFHQALERFTCGSEYLLKLIKLHQLAPVRTYRSATNRPVRGIPKRTMRVLIRVILPIASDDFATIQALAGQTGWSFNRVERLLLESELVVVRLRSVANGREVDHYSRVQALDMLGFKPREVPPAGDFLTAAAIDSRLNRYNGWTKWHLDRGNYADSACLRLDDFRMIRRHYSPTVYLSLKRKSEQMRLKESA